MKSVLLLFLLTTTLTFSQDSPALGIKEMTTIQKGRSFDGKPEETRMIQYFNAAGVEEKRVQYENGELYFTGILTYNSDGTFNTYTRYDENKAIISHVEYRYRFDSIRGMKETKLYDETKELMSTELDSMDQKGNVLVKYTHLLATDMHSTEINVYDAENRCVRTSIYHDDTLQFTINNKYQIGNDISECSIECEEVWCGGNYKRDYSKRDKKGNWTVCKEYEDGKLYSKTTREIVYY